MDRSQTIAKKIQNMRTTQRELARKIDKAQLRDNITEVLALEARYKQIALAIEQFQHSLGMKTYGSTH